MTLVAGESAHSVSRGILQAHDLIMPNGGKLNLYGTVSSGGHIAFSPGVI